jgi:hypothetical protein
VGPTRSRRSSIRAIAAMSAAACAALCTVPAFATPSARLTYQRGPGAESCPDESVLRRAVEQRLGYDPFFPWANRTIVARISTGTRVLEANIDLLDSGGIVRGSRKLTARTAECAELVSGVALAISIAIDPSSVDRVGPPSGEKDPGRDDDQEVVEWSQARAGEAATKAPAPDRATARPAAEPAPRRPSVVAQVSGGVTGAVAMTPAVAFGPALSAGLSLGRWEMAVEGRVLFGLDAKYGPATISSTLLEGALVGCFHPTIVFACAEASVGSLGITGSGLAHGNDDSALVGRIGLRGGVAIPLSGAWDAVGYADLMFDLSRPTVTVDSQPVWTSSLVGGLATLGLRRRFP